MISSSRDSITTTRSLAEAIKRAKSIVLTTHQNPDGDGLGAELAMREALLQLGKSVEVLNDSPLPPEYAFLDRYGVLQVFDPVEHGEIVRSADLVILLDATTPERTGRIGEAIRTCSGATGVVDHHVGPPWGDFPVVDSTACSTTLLVRALLREFSTRLSRTLAESIYVGLLVDTMGFRHANTTPECVALAAELVSAGARPSYLWQKVFGERSIGRLRLEGAFLSSLKTECGGRLIWGVVDRTMMQTEGEDESALEGFVERAMEVRGVETAVLFVEESRDQTRISFRSREPIAVDGLARELGGGGHRLASGVVIDMPLASAVSVALQRARTSLTN
jgi:bifunctional oligoribonuclease and PAP phosphatase NrnA